MTVQALYRSLLRLYPPAFYATFSAEMLDAFNEAAAGAALHGRSAYYGFCLREVRGLLSSAAREQLRSSGHDGGWDFLLRGGFMVSRERRYPHSAILFMMVVLGMVVMA